MPATVAAVASHVSVELSVSRADAFVTTQVAALQRRVWSALRWLLALLDARTFALTKTIADSADTLAQLDFLAKGALANVQAIFLSVQLAAPTSKMTPTTVVSAVISVPHYPSARMVVVFVKKLLNSMALLLSSQCVVMFASPFIRMNITVASVETDVPPIQPVDMVLVCVAAPVPIVVLKRCVAVPAGILSLTHRIVVAVVGYVMPDRPALKESVAATRRPLPVPTDVLISNAILVTVVFVANPVRTATVAAVVLASISISMLTTVVVVSIAVEKVHLAVLRFVIAATLT